MAKITIFRFTDVGDTTGTAEKLEFNTSVNTKVVNGFITNVDVDPLEGIGDNQGSEQEFGDLQSLGTVEKEYTITGYISQRGTNPNSFLDTLKLWEQQSKIKRGIFEQGRFGFQDLDDPSDDVTPIPNTQPNPSGLMWQSISKKSDMKGNRTNFVLKFRISKGDAT